MDFPKSVLLVGQLDDEGNVKPLDPFLGTLPRYDHMDVDTELSSSDYEDEKTGAPEFVYTKSGTWTVSRFSMKTKHTKSLIQGVSPAAPRQASAQKPARLNVKAAARLPSKKAVGRRAVNKASAATPSAAKGKTQSAGESVMASARLPSKKAVGRRAASKASAVKSHNNVPVSVLGNNAAKKKVVGFSPKVATEKKTRKRVQSEDELASLVLTPKMLTPKMLTPKMLTPKMLTPKMVTPKMHTPILNGADDQSKMEGDLPPVADTRLPEGWTRQVVIRKTGKSAGRSDVYVFDTENKKYRSRNDILAYLAAQTPPIPADTFDFSVFKNTEPEPDEHTPRRIKPAKEFATMKRAISEDAGDAEVLPSAEETGCSIPEPSPQAEVPLKRRRVMKKRAGKNKIWSYEEMEEVVKFAFLEWDGRKRFPPLKWEPPTSPYNLIQERLRNDPFQLLVACILLEKSPVLDTDMTMERSTPKILALLHRWPTPAAMRLANAKDIALSIKIFGKEKARAESILLFAHEYREPSCADPSDLCSIGRYGKTSYKMFHLKQCFGVEPADPMLMMYRNWMVQNYKALVPSVDERDNLTDGESDEEERGKEPKLASDEEEEAEGDAPKPTADLEAGREREAEEIKPAASAVERDEPKPAAGTEAESERDVEEIKPAAGVEEEVVEEEGELNPAAVVEEEEEGQKDKSEPAAELDKVEEEPAGI